MLLTLIFALRINEGMSKHLAHLASFDAEPVVFFTVVTARRQEVLATEAAHGILRGIWALAGERNGWWVGDYLLMPDHVHFFARAGRESVPMRKWVQTWKSLSSRQWKTLQGTADPLWQEDYFDRYLRSAENYSEKWSYVEANPVRKGLVERADDWPYRGRIHELRF
ncbi:MAG: transposase [Kiritimatiellia bacterium]